MCGSRTEAVQNKKNILNSLAAVFHKNKSIAAGNSEKLVHTCAGVYYRVGKTFGFYVIKRNEMRLWQHFCTLLALSLLDFAADSSLCS